MSEKKSESRHASSQVDPAHLPAGLGAACRGICKQPLYWLLLAMPVALGLEWATEGGMWVFVVSGLAIIPLAGLMGRATENLAETMGAGAGGLLNATFGNAAELIIALIALWKGPHMYDLVKASITGSIIGNILLVLGLSILLGGLKYRRQTFNRTAAGMGATLLALASIGLIIPTFHFYLLQSGAAPGTQEAHSLETLSEEIAVILAVIYVLSLVFSLRTHRHLFAGPEKELQTTGEHHQPEWSRRTSLIMLVLATAGVAWMSELLVGSVEHAGETLGMNQVFVGVIVVAMVGNAAEHSSAVMMAIKNKMDLAFHIAVGSSIQIALFVAPALVFVSMFLHPTQPLDLHFTALETAAVLLSVIVLAMVTQDGETHWMEGVMLLGVYVIMALAFYHLPEPPADGAWLWLQSPVVVPQQTC
jgi:Ca2+:H+ antiporter